MLRNSVKIKICGLIAVLLSACSNTSSLLNNTKETESKFDLSIKSEPYEKYRIQGIIERCLPLYIRDASQYKINIELNSHDSPAVYTERQVTKGQLRIAAKVRVYDKSYNELGERLVDSFSTYETCDDLPFSVLASKTQAKNAVIDELGNSIALSIVSIIQSRKQ